MIIRTSFLRRMDTGKLKMTSGVKHRNTGPAQGVCNRVA
jgi:hypothetical protein